MDRHIKAAFEALNLQVRPYWGRYSPPIVVTFPAANTDCDVAHGMGVVPDGYHVVEADNAVYRRPGPWATTQVAYLRAPNSNAHATVIFFTFREKDS